jgi:hypothetical protein
LRLTLTTARSRSGSGRSLVLCLERAERATGTLKNRRQWLPFIAALTLTGEKFIKSLMQPVPPVSLLSLVQAGWPIDIVFLVGVRALNGLNAVSNEAVLQSAGDPDFYRVLTLMREAQTSGAVGAPDHSERR